MDTDSVKQAWQDFMDGLGKAEAIIDQYTSELGSEARADGYRAIVRALASNINKVEADPVYPMPIHINQPNHKWFLDNPDGYYLYMLVDPAHTYRLTGSLGDACYTSFTIYQGRGESLSTKETAKITADQLTTGPDNSFELIIGGNGKSGPNHLPVSDESGLFWVRQLFNDVNKERHGVFRIENISCKTLPPIVKASDFCKSLSRLGATLTIVSTMIQMAYKMQTDKHPHNQVRAWSEMQGGAMFTSDDIHYQIGSWKLRSDEVMELNGVLPDCLHWNIVLYSRFLNSLEHQYRRTSLTGGQLKTDENRKYKISIGHNTGDRVNGLDTEGRETGLFVIRAVGIKEAPALPAATVKNT